MYSINNHTDNPQIVTIDTTDVSIPPHNEVLLNCSKLTLKQGTDVNAFQLKSVQVNEATDISKISSLYQKRPEDNTFQVTWEYSTDGHGQFEFPNPPTISPYHPNTLSYWTDIEPGTTRKEVGLGMLCGHLTLSDPDYQNKYVVTYKKVPNTNWARKKIPWAALFNSTKNTIQWNFYNESADHTDKYPTHHLTSKNVKVNDAPMINMETGLSETKEKILTAGLLALGVLLFSGIPLLLPAATAADNLIPVAVPEIVGNGIRNALPISNEIASAIRLPLMAEVGEIGGQVAVNGEIWQAIPVAVPVPP
jgi:hypothetical protein